MVSAVRLAFQEYSCNRNKLNSRVGRERERERDKGYKAKKRVYSIEAHISALVLRSVEPNLINPYKHPTGTAGSQSCLTLETNTKSQKLQTTNSYGSRPRCQYYKFCISNAALEGVQFILRPAG